MNIGIDIDGTLTNEHDYMIKKALEFIKEKNLNYKIINRDEYNTIDIFNWGEDIEKYFWDKYIFDYAKNVKIYKNAANVISKLKNNNKIYIITSRGFTLENSKEGELMRSLVKDWLENNKIEYNEIIFAKHGKVEECKKYKINIMIEDSKYNIECLKNIVDKIICFDAPYNKDLKGNNIIRCKDWLEIEKVFK